MLRRVCHLIFNETPFTLETGPIDYRDCEKLILRVPDLLLKRTFLMWPAACVVDPHISIRSSPWFGLEFYGMLESENGGVRISGVYRWPRSARLFLIAWYCLVMAMIIGAAVFAVVGALVEGVPWEGAIFFIAVWALLVLGFLVVSVFGLRWSRQWIQSHISAALTEALEMPATVCKDRSV